MLRLELRSFTRQANNIELIGAARTDSGVHALNLPAHFDLPLADTALARRIMANGSEELLLRWNRRLPPVMANATCDQHERNPTKWGGGACRVHPSLAKLGCRMALTGVWVASWR